MSRCTREDGFGKGKQTRQCSLVARLDCTPKPGPLHAPCLRVRKSVNGKEPRMIDDLPSKTQVKNLSLLRAKCKTVQFWQLLVRGNERNLKCALNRYAVRKSGMQKKRCGNTTCLVNAQSYCRFQWGYWEHRASPGTA